MRFELHPMLFAEAQPGGDGGGAGAGSPGALSAEMVAFKNEMIAMFNGMAKKMRTDMAGDMKNVIRESMPEISNEVANAIIPTDEDLTKFEQEWRQSNPQEAAGGGQEDGQGQGQPGQQPANDPRLNARLLELQRTNDNLTQRLADIEKRNQEAEAMALQSRTEAAVSAALNPYPFAHDDYRDLTYNYFLNNVDFDEQGNFIMPGPDGPLPLKDAVEARMGNMSGMLAARPVSGAGATAYPSSSRTTGPTLEAIKSGMSKEDKTATASAIAQYFSPEASTP